MTIISAFAVLISLLSIPIILRPLTTGRLALGISIVIIHIAVTQVYYVYTKTNLADSYTYYYDQGAFSGLPWTATSVMFIGKLTQLLKDSGATYLDCFMVFQTFGVLGILLLVMIFNEIQGKTQARPSVLGNYILFVPSMYFWTSSIGKDAPMFFAVSLCTWSLLNMSTRLKQLVVSILIMVMVRAHIALAAVLAIGIAYLFHSRVSLPRKLVALLILTVSVSYLLIAVRYSFGVDLVDASSWSSFTERRALVESMDTASSSIAGASFPVRILSLLFRPFFFDAKSFASLFASVENVGSVLLFAYLLMHAKDILYLSKQVVFVRFAWIYAAMLIVIVGFLNYNVGLGLRERVMVMPPLFALFIAVYAYRQRTGRERPPAFTVARLATHSIRPRTQMPGA